MINTTKPTSGLSPITKLPNVSTTPPASALESMDLVVETFNPNLNNVNSNRREGKIENCKDSCVFMETKMTMSAIDILHKISMLKSHPGDRKSTRLNSSHVAISYAVFCLK